MRTISTVWSSIEDLCGSTVYAHMLHQGTFLTRFLIHKGIKSKAMEDIFQSKYIYSVEKSS